MAELRSKIEISIWCDNLHNRDVYTKSDPFVQVFTRQNSTSSWILVGKTETIMNNLNPRFSKHMAMDFIFEAMQELRVLVCDYDSTSDHDFLGQCFTNVAHVMASPGGSATLPLMDYRNPSKPAKSSGKKKNGKRQPATVTLHAAEVSRNNDEVKFQFSGHKLSNKDGFFGKSDPFYIISKRREGTTEWVPCFTSESIDNNLDPIWIPRSLKQRTLGIDSPDSLIKIDVYDFDDHSAHDMIGSCTATMRELQASVEAKKTFPLRHPPTKSKYKKKSYKHSGLLGVSTIKCMRCHS